MPVLLSHFQEGGYFNPRMGQTGVAGNSSRTPAGFILRVTELVIWQSWFRQLFVLYTATTALLSRLVGHKVIETNVLQTLRSLRIAVIYQVVLKDFLSVWIVFGNCFQFFVTFLPAIVPVRH